METISNVNILAPQGPNAGAGAAMTAMGMGADAGGQFGLLLTQQLQQILAQGAIAGVAPGAGGEVAGEIALNGAAQLPEPLPDLQVPDVEEGLRDVQLAQAGPVVVDATRLARGGAGKDEPAEKTGKKLPLDLPVVDTKSDPGTLAADAALAAMVAAQVMPQMPPAVPQAGTAKGDADASALAESWSGAMESVAGKGVSSSGHEMATLPSEPPVTPQAVPQSFSALMAERSSANAGPATVPTLEIPQRVDSSQWGHGLSDKVVWMVGSQTQGAELRLNPPALGPLEVRVSMSDGQATLSFVTQHAPVREAIEAATPRLRELLADSGISLGSVSVNVGTFAQQQPGSQEQFQPKSSAGHWSTVFDVDEDGAVLAASATTSVRYLRDGGMVDLFA